MWDSSNKCNYDGNHNEIIILTPNFTVNKYTVTLNRDPSTSGSSSVTATFDADMPSITLPTRTGYRFQGYFTGKKGTGTKYYNASGSSAHVWDKANNTTTLYAYWTPNVYSVELSANSGTWPSGSITTIYRRYDDGFYSDQGCTKKITKLPSLPFYSGKVLKGFFTSSSGGTQATDGEGLINASPNTNGNYTWFAQWEDGVTVTFDCNGGTYDGKATFTKTMKLTTKVSESNLSGMVTKENFIFDGFYTTKGSSTQVWKWNSYNSIVPDTAASNFWSGSSATSTWKYGSNITLYAHWSRANIYTYWNNAWHPIKYVYGYNSGWKQNEKNDNNSIEFYGYNSGWKEGRKN